MQYLLPWSFREKPYKENLGITEGFMTLSPLGALLLVVNNMVIESDKKLQD